MDIRINDKNIKEDFGIDIIEYTGVYAIGSNRNKTSEYYNKSGVSVQEFGRTKSYEFELKFMCKDSNLAAAFRKIRSFTEYLSDRAAVVMGITYGTGEGWDAFLLSYKEESTGAIDIRKQNSLFLFDLTFINVNPRCKTFRFAPEIQGIPTQGFLSYGNTEVSQLYWGDGSSELIENPGTYSKTYLESQTYYAIIDIDEKDFTSILPIVPITVLPSSFFVNRQEQQVEIDVSCDEYWSIKSTPDWVTVKSETGQNINGGYQSLKIILYISENFGLDRSGEVKIHTASEISVVDIEQTEVNQLNINSSENLLIGSTDLDID